MTGVSTLLYQHPSRQTLMGLAFLRDVIYFAGKTFVIRGQLQGDQVVVQKELECYRTVKGLTRQLRKFWERVGALSRAVEYTPQHFHQMNIALGKLFISDTERNEVLELDEDLNIIRRIPIQPHRRDHNHLNNVFWDGVAFYVCLNRYGKPFGYGGYAKFTKEWEEVERRTLGWESHALAIVQGQIWNLVASSGTTKQIWHPHKAGLMVDGRLVFEHDPDQVFCKDFSVDTDYIYMVGGQISAREERKAADGFVFVLDRQYHQIKEFRIPKIGGICGCRLQGEDYSNGVRD
jgi:hypothetical protein